MVDTRQSNAAELSPVGLKDNIAVAGLRTGNGLGRPGPLAEHDAELVVRLREMGFGIVPGQAMDEAAFGATGDNPHHGRLHNPAAPGRSPGGSSSGGAVAVAKGMAVAIGTDTLGSVRIPASYCGIVGFKPSRGIFPMRGVAPLSPSMDQAGVLAHDMRVLSEIMSRFLPMRRGRRPHSVLAPEDVAPATPEVRGAFEAAVRRMVEAGFKVERRPVPGWTPEPHRRAAVLLIEAEAAAVHRELVDGTDPAMSGPVRGALRFGRDAGSAKLMEAVQTLRRTEEALTTLFNTFDLLVTPTTPSVAYRWEDGPPQHQALFTALANWAGLPAISVPLPVRGPPIGLQIIGGKGRDWSVIEAGTSLMENAAGGKTP